MPKSLDTKIQRILSDPSCKDFILADAKDADMAYGIAAPGAARSTMPSEGRFRSLEEYRELIRQNVRQGLVDIMLMSSSTNEALTIRERLFDDSPSRPPSAPTTRPTFGRPRAAATLPSRRGRSARGHRRGDVRPARLPGGGACPRRGPGPLLGHVQQQLGAGPPHAFRLPRVHRRGAVKGFRHFLEVFDPNCPQAALPDLPRYINDMISRTLAGVAGPARPLFLKIAYHGPAAMEQLAGYDRRLIVGILGGSSGTTFDAFHQLWEARRHGAARPSTGG